MNAHDLFNNNKYNLNTNHALAIHIFFNSATQGFHFCQVKTGLCIELSSSKSGRFPKFNAFRLDAINK